MIWLKRNPLFYLMLGLLLAIALLGVFHTSMDSDRLGELKFEYDQKNKQLSLFMQRSPAPTKANLAILDRNLEQMKKEFLVSQATLNLSTYDRDLFFGSPPIHSNAAFFMIAKFVEDSRALAQGADIRFDEGYRFGFSSYENVGPSIEVLAVVHKQTKIMEALLQALADAGVSELVAVERENPAALGQEDSRSSGGADFFSMPSKSLIRSTDAFDSLAFRLEFKGQSHAMRSFVNRVNGSSLPFTISQIEVQLESESGNIDKRSRLLENPFFASDQGADDNSALQVPIISENESRFVVIVEFIELGEGMLAIGGLEKRGEGV